MSDPTLVRVSPLASFGGTDTASVATTLDADSKSRARGSVVHKRSYEICAEVGLPPIDRA
jgi:hypothetical protein